MMRWVLIAMTAAMMAVGCGATEAGDRPQDCHDDEYFDEGNQQCRTCPAVIEPECLPGCGLETIEDQRGCPILRCVQGCEGCDGGRIWDPDEERCEPA